MLALTKQVYYCEHCKRHRLTRDAIEKHEPRCIYNPERSVCGWHRNDEPDPPSKYAAAFASDPDVALLRKRLSGCPACMLAVVVQARRLGLHDEDAWDFNYQAEVKTWRDAERYEDELW